MNGASVIGLLICASLTPAQAAPSSKATQTKCEGTEAPAPDAPTPADPYPLMAAGWGPEVGNGLFFSRWVEDWTGMRAAGRASPFKVFPLGDEASVTLSAEARLRHDAYDNGQLMRGNDYQQGLFDH